MMRTALYHLSLGVETISYSAFWIRKGTSLRLGTAHLRGEELTNGVAGTIRAQGGCTPGARPRGLAFTNTPN